MSINFSRKRFRPFSFHNIANNLSLNFFIFFLSASLSARVFFQLRSARVFHPTVKAIRRAPLLEMILSRLQALHSVLTWKEGGFEVEIDERFSKFNDLRERKLFATVETLIFFKQREARIHSERTTDEKNRRPIIPPKINLTLCTEGTRKEVETQNVEKNTFVS